ncbi:hypothetical protein SAMN05444411_10427 [Lutibacter oricola]|uniref:Uncharacterized protein n=1 Tax=Lutibacter oricola TaxID=762486 RepID=A0A1H3A586_9FLAO|nr:hypothetical protein [Lutibacter oricola]SDX24765.1 hypothetical protein SAMN05444411_10427 [Lutibacter oricola]
MKSEQVYSTKSFNLLKLSVILVFIGRAYQHLFWDAPVRAFFWDENLIKPLIENLFNVEWQTYVTSVTLDLFLDNLVVGFGLLYSLCFLAVIFYKPSKKVLKYLILVGSIGLVFLAFLLMKERFYQFAQFFEYSLQFAIPVIFVFSYKGWVYNNLILILKVLVAIVFVAHGLYAVGYYPVPGYFLGMVINIFGFSEEVSKTFLLVAGVLDFVVSILIFIPKTAKIALLYAFVWGTLTALARVVAGLSVDFFWESIHLNLFQTIYRLPHGLIPLYLFFRMKNEKLNEF